MEKSKELLEAKKRLYYLLLSVDYEKLTLQEIDLVFELSKDHQIKEFLRSTFNVNLDLK